MGFDEGVIHLGEFIVMSRREVEFGLKPDVVWGDSGEFLYFSDPLDALYLGDGYFFLLVRGDGLGLVGGDYDKGVLIGINLIELLLAADKLEGFGPVESFAVAHK